LDCPRQIRVGRGVGRSSTCPTWLPNLPTRITAAERVASPTKTDRRSGATFFYGRARRSRPPRMAHRPCRRPDVAPQPHQPKPNHPTPPQPRPPPTVVKQHCANHKAPPSSRSRDRGNHPQLLASKGITAFPSPAQLTTNRVNTPPNPSRACSKRTNPHPNNAPTRPKQPHPTPARRRRGNHRPPRPRSHRAPARRPEPSPPTAAPRHSEGAQPPPFAIRNSLFAIRPVQSWHSRRHRPGAPSRRPTRSARIPPR
jgi:hypothetical protein